MLLSARCSSQEELDEACTTAVEKAAALKECLRVAYEAMREETDTNGEPQSEDGQGALSQQHDAAEVETEAEVEVERARASWAAVRRLEDLLGFASEVREVRASAQVEAVVDSTGALGRFDAFAAAQYQQVLRAAEAESRRYDAKAKALQSARAARLHLLAEHKEEEEARASPPRDVKAQLVAAKKAAKRAVNKVQQAQLHLEQAELDDDEEEEQKQCRAAVQAAKEAAREAERQCASEHAALYSRIGTFPELLREIRLVSSPRLGTAPFVSPWPTTTLLGTQANGLPLDLVSLFHDGRTLTHYEDCRLVANSNRPIYQAMLNGRKVALKEYAVGTDELKVPCTP